MDATPPYAERLAAARQRIEDVYNHRQNGVLPLVIGDVNYWLSGETPALIPGDYFTRPGSMLEFQTAKIRRHLERFDDDYVPLLFPWYGTGVLASAFGARSCFPQRWTRPSAARSSAVPKTSPSLASRTRARTG